VNPVRGRSIIAIAIFIIVEAILLPVSGKAQQVVHGEFSLYQEVRWQSSVLPAGDYMFFVDANHWPALVRVQQKGGGFSGVFVPQGLLRPGKHRDSGIALAGTGNETYVEALRLQGIETELYFPAPDTKRDEHAGDQARPQDQGAGAVRTLGYLTILNPNHEKISLEDAERVYLKVCEEVEKEFNRSAAIRPKLVLRLGTSENLLRYPIGEIQLKKWDEYRFADGVLDIALREMVPQDERVKLSNAAVHEAGATVTVCELKSCVN